MSIKVIYKFELKPLVTTVDIPKDARVLTVQTQQNKPYIWVIVDADNPTVRRKFTVQMTGVFFDVSGLRYIGTFQVDEGSFVGHVYEIIEQEIGERG